MVQRHDDHDQTAQGVNGRESPGEDVRRHASDDALGYPAAAIAKHSPRQSCEDSLHHAIAASAVCRRSGRRSGRRRHAAQSGGSNVIIVTIDGLRWQEFFGGAQRDYFKRDTSGAAGPAEQRFWRDDPAVRRTALMPFVWSMVAATARSSATTAPAAVRA